MNVNSQLGKNKATTDSERRELAPLAGLRIILGIDPLAGGHELKSKDDESCHQPDAGKDVKKQWGLGRFLFLFSSCCVRLDRSTGLER